MEEWKDIKGWENYYQVSDLGRVKSLKRKIIRCNGTSQTIRERILKGGSNPKGYRIIDLRINQGRFAMTAHRLVMNTFVGESILHINHINGNILDNRLSNLEYCTNLENINHRYTTLKNSKKYGASFDKSRNKWLAQIQINGKNKQLGCFTNKEDAHQAFYNAYTEAHGVHPW